jgi:hypothetical protein
MVQSGNLQHRRKLLLLGALTLVCIIATLLVRPIPQDNAYHHFADTRTWMGLPNAANVLSNFPFLIVGIAGLLLLQKVTAVKSVAIIYGILFSGIILTGLGSAYYHYAPDNNTLVWDRLPMTIVFMSFLSATVAEFINSKLGVRLLLPLLIIGIASVFYWQYTESIGTGDLRLYGLVQFYPMLFIPLILLLFPSPVYRKGLAPLIWVLVWYVLAKVCEHYDAAIYGKLQVISGHSLKHICAAIASWYLVKSFERKFAANRVAP